MVAWVRFPVVDWRPVFPDSEPPAWVAFVARADDSVGILSNAELPAASRRWLAEWLWHYAPRQPDLPASYVYLALGDAQPSGVPDGKTTANGVRGTGSGASFGEPPGASASTVAEILRRAISGLERSQNSGT